MTRPNDEIRDQPHNEDKYEPSPISSNSNLLSSLNRVSSRQLFGSINTLQHQNIGSSQGAASLQPLSSSEVDASSERDTESPLGDLQSSGNDQIFDLNPEGTFSNNLECTLSNNPSKTLEVSQSTRTLTRASNFPRIFDDFVVEGKVNYGLERVINYLCLNSENFSFVSN